MRSKTDMVNDDNDSSSQPYKKAKKPTPEQNKWFDYISNFPFKSDEYVTTFAEKMLGLNTAIIAAYIAGVKLSNISLTAYVLIPLALFILSLFCSLLALYPRTVKEKFEDLTKIKERYIEAIYRRQRNVTISLVSYFIGLLTAIFIILIG